MNVLKILSTVLMLFSATCILHAENKINVIPQPHEVVLGEGSFSFNKKTKVLMGVGTEATANWFKNYIEEGSEFKLSTLKLKKGKPKKNSISFLLDKILENTLGKEGYKLNVSKSGIVLTASSNTGLFYGVQSLRQLLPVSFEDNEIKVSKIEIPSVEIKDTPRFGWRAYMLDEARYFHGAEFVKMILDQMALLKMNVFHWHLTDDQGWRIEIKKYPKLTTVGSKRTDTQVGGWDSPQRSGQPHEGFYTQEQIRDIVKYAAERNITIIPEIGMPGHACAAIASYPILGTTGKSIPVMTYFGKAHDTYNPARETTYQILSEILDEVCELFPSKIIHIGGDEVRFTQWQQSEEVKALMKRENLKTMADVQTYFTNRMSQIVSAKGRRIMGWNEIMGDDLHGFLKNGQTGKAATLSKDAVVHFWAGSANLAAKAIRKGHDVINSWSTYTYLDYDYGSIPLRKAYSFDPIIPGLEPKYHSSIKGCGCQMWSEWTPTNNDVEYQTFPRIAAYAEVGWTQLENKDYEHFLKTLESMKKRWKIRGIRYAAPNQD